MGLTSGTKLGPYEIQVPLGAGGMGEVYRAVDSRLGRIVAIKILPESFAKDAERVQRFEHEARLLSALNHPNLLIIFDVGSQDGIEYLVSEFLEGQTLREYLSHGASPQRRLFLRGDVRDRKVPVRQQDLEPPLLLVPVLLRVRP